MPSTPSPTVSDLVKAQQSASYKGQRAISIFGLGDQQRSPFISTIDRVNCVVEMTDNGRQQAAIIGMPGLESKTSMGANPIRGWFVREGELTFYLVALDTIYKYQLGVGSTVLGTFTTTTGPVWIADNGTQLFFNDGTTAFIYNTNTLTWTQITDVDYPANARGGTFLQGRFWVYVTTGANANRVYGSDQYNGLSWDALNFFTPEATPDGIVAVERWFNDLVVFGKTSIEWWTGVSVQVPGQLGFQPITGANVEVGLIGEKSFGMAGQRLIFMGRSRGQAAFYEIVNYTVRPVSPAGVDADIANRAAHTNVVGTGYTLAHHPIIQFTFKGTTTDDSITWAVDTSNGIWCKRASHNKICYRGVHAVTSAERIFISDAFDGTIWEMKDSVYVEGSDPLIFEVTSIHLLKNGDMFTVHAAQMDLETGLGAPGSNPQAIIQISKDGGHTWSTEAWTTMVGPTGEYFRRVRRRRIGAARDIAIRLRITDPVKRVVTGAYLLLEEGRS